MSERKRRQQIGIGAQSIIPIISEEDDPAEACERWLAYGHFSGSAANWHMSPAVEQHGIFLASSGEPCFIGHFGIPSDSNSQHRPMANLKQFFSIMRFLFAATASACAASLAFILSDIWLEGGPGWNCVAMDLRT